MSHFTLEETKAEQCAQASRLADLSGRSQSLKPLPSPFIPLNPAPPQSLPLEPKYLLLNALAWGGTLVLITGHCG